MSKSIIKQKNASLIMEVLNSVEKIRRSDLYLEVNKKQKEKYGKATTYQVISRDVDRLIDYGVIKKISGGVRSSVLSLK